MKRLTVLIAALIYTTISFSQNTYKALIKDAKTNQALVGATAMLQGSGTGASADTSGLIVLNNIPNGQHIIQFKYVGYQMRTDTLTFPLVQDQPTLILLKAAGNDEGTELEEVVVGATRSSRTIDHIPTRVEVISGEEL